MWLGLSIEFWAETCVAIVVAIVTVYVTLPRAKRNEVKISFSGPFSVLSHFGRETPKLRILYNNVDVQGEIAWLEGVLFNAGNMDVGPSTVIQYPVLALGEKAEWAEFSLDGARSDIEAVTEQISSSQIRIRWALLKPGESIPFQALVRASDSEELWRIRTGESFSVSARIENVDVRYDSDNVLSASGAHYKMRDALSGVVGSAVVLLMTCGLLAFMEYSAQRNLALTFEIPNHTKELYLIDPYNGGKLTFDRYPDKLRSVELTVGQIANLKTKAAVLNRYGSEKALVHRILWVAIFVIFLSVWPWQLGRYIRARRFYNLTAAGKRDARVCA
jgi:hypothetical protein